MDEKNKRIWTYEGSTIKKSFFLCEFPLDHMIFSPVVVFLRWSVLSLAPALKLAHTLPKK